MVLDAVCKSIVIFFTSTDSSSRRRSLKFSSDIQKALECAIFFKIKTTQKSFIHDGNSSFSCSTVNIGFHASTCSKVVFESCMDTTAKFHSNIMAILMNNLFKESDFGT